LVRDAQHAVDLGRDEAAGRSFGGATAAAADHGDE
jgi:hypothetical protein